MSTELNLLDDEQKLQHAIPEMCDGCMEHLPTLLSRLSAERTRAVKAEADSGRLLMFATMNGVSIEKLREEIDAAMKEKP